MQNNGVADSSKNDDDLYDAAILTNIDLKNLPKVLFNPPIDVLAPGDSLVLRPLNRYDYAKGFPQVLSQLTAVGDVTEDMFLSMKN